jgi:hypothetical protein
LFTANHLIAQSTRPVQSGVISKALCKQTPRPNKRTPATLGFATRWSQAMRRSADNNGHDARKINPSADRFFCERHWGNHGKNTITKDEACGVR